MLDTTRKNNRTDLANLVRMRNEVDFKQKKYDGMVKRFKDTIGLSQEAI